MYNELVKEEGNFEFFMTGGLPCIIIRPHFKYTNIDAIINKDLLDIHLCGYVGVPKDHKFYGKHYDNLNISIHGGLTYSNHLFKSHDFWYFGFDCAHCGDYTFPISIFNDGTYRNMEYVIKETKSLAIQIRCLEHK